MNNLLSKLKKQFNHSFEMLENTIDHFPEDVWFEIKGGFPIWQQVLHVLEGISYWIRLKEHHYNYPYSNLNLYPDLDNVSDNKLTKKEIKKYQEEIKKQCEKYFKNINYNLLFEKSPINNKKINFEIILIIIRHIQYHVGHLNCILRDNNMIPVKWKE